MITKIDIKDGEGKLVSSAVMSDGSGEPDPDREITENEKFYDTEVAPVLAKIAKTCQEKNIAFGAVVEYNPGDTGETFATSKDMSLKMEMSLMAMKAHGNIDSLIRGYIKACDREGIDLAKESIFVSLANRKV